jgi:phosphatidylglycerophosphatase A
MRDRTALLLGTFFGTGYWPWGPGTAGSAATLLLYLAFRPALSGWWLVASAAALFLPGVWAAGECERIFGRTDPPRVVVDEVIGQAITLAAIPAASQVWKLWLSGFIIFRVFDIVKPFPIRRLERLPGGWGIVIDDVMAGVYGAIVLRLALYLL